MIALIIKGSPAEAKAELLKRDVEIIDWPIPLRGQAGETMAYCSEVDLEKVVAWMFETVEPPFAAGTLLYYKPLGSEQSDRASLAAAAKHQPQSQDEVLP